MASLALTLTDYTGEVLWQHKLWRTSPSVRLAALAVVALVALPTALVATIASKQQIQLWLLTDMYHVRVHVSLPIAMESSAIKMMLAPSGFRVTHKTHAYGERATNIFSRV